MGLDQFMYVAAKKGGTNREIAYRRKHPNLHGWMEKLWLHKLDIARSPDQQSIENNYRPLDFNGVEVELTDEDIDLLELAIKERKLPQTLGFFFGSNADEMYYNEDLNFIAAARAELFLGFRVCYNSSW